MSIKKLIEMKKIMLVVAVTTLAIVSLILVLSKEKSVMDISKTGETTIVVDLDSPVRSS